MTPYVDAVLREARMWRQRLGAGRFDVQTVFMGGGTPTRLPAPLMRQLLDGLRSTLPLGGVQEWTVEANPATIDADYCRMLLDAAVTRLSVGIQSFVDLELETLGRLHSAEEGERTIQTARSAGFTRLSIDLIHGTPGQTPPAWRRSLDRAVALGLDHVSCYCLSYEEGTALCRQKGRGMVQAASEATELALLRLSEEVLGTAGLARYEISNYAVPGQECRHNLMYWRGGNYLGLGPAAASHLEGCRWKTPTDLARWQKAAAGDTVVFDSFERLSARQRAGELAMLMLRMSEGLRYDVFADRLRQNARVVFAEPLQRLAKAGLIRLNSAAAVLTPRGMEVADAVSLEFIA
jgi:oxygen-independent coproporphyrinogen-3 oxidase